MYAVISSSRSWSEILILQLRLKRSLEFGCIEFLNGKPVWFGTGATQTVYSDSGYGGHVVELGNDVPPWVLVGRRGHIELYLERTIGSIFGAPLTCR